MKKAILLISVLFVLSCYKKTDLKADFEKNFEKRALTDTIEHFTDSINFGLKHKNKIEIYKIGTEENTIAKIYLFEIKKDKWSLKDSLTLDAERINNLNPEIIDFNNDNFKDIVFTTGMAARGGNVIQTLILYSTEKESLLWIKNSENFPNLMYNEKLDCIDALILTGGQKTSFLKIKNDSLEEFAYVDQSDGRILAKILDANGKWKEIENIKDDPKNFDRFINFNPIEKRE